MLLYCQSELSRMLLDWMGIIWMRFWSPRTEALRPSPNSQKDETLLSIEIFLFSVDVDVSVQHHLLWNDSILLAAIDRYRRADGIVASFRLRPPSVVNRFGILEEAGLACAAHLHQFIFVEHSVSGSAE